MARVELSDADWTRVINLIASKNLYIDCADILMKIGTQVSAQQQLQEPGPPPTQRTHPDVKAVLDGNGKEVRHE